MSINLTTDELQHAAARAATLANTVAKAISPLQGHVDEVAKDDGTPVCQADELADQLLHEGLEQNFPSHAILSEERLAPQIDAGQALWIIDPLDGTRAFLDHLPEWAVQLALTVDGQLQLGVLALADTGRTLVGIPGQGAYEISADGQRRDLSFSQTENQPSTPSIIASRRNRQRFEQLKPHFPQHTFNWCSSVGIKIDRMLQGQAQCYLQPQTIHDWDVAGPLAVLLAAGGQASDLHGDPITFAGEDYECRGLICTVNTPHRDMVTAWQDSPLAAQFPGNRRP